MSDKKGALNEAGFPAVQGPSFLYSSTFNAHQTQSMDQAASRGELTRYFSIPMVGAGLLPYGVSVIGSPLVMGAPHLNAAGETLLPIASRTIASGPGQWAQRKATQYNSAPIISTGLINILKGIKALNNAYSYKSEPQE